MAKAKNVSVKASKGAAVKADAFIAARVEKVRASMEKAKLPAMLLTSYVDVSWLTGFEGDDSYVLLTPNKAVLISDSRYEEQIGREAPWIKMVLRKKLIMEEVAKQLKAAKVTKLGVQSEAMTLKGQQGLLKQMKEFGVSAKLAPISDICVAPRHLKDDHEVAIMEQAIRIAEGAFEALKGQLKAGMTENDIAGLLGYEMRKRGALNSSFDSIVGVGPNGSLPHYRPADVVLQKDMPILVDWGARYKGYCSDLTRVLFFGKVAPKIREIYQIVLDAQLAAIAAIKPGVSSKVVDKAARDVIGKAGYGKEFGHGTGHGLGRDVHEAISVSKLGTTTLVPGMIVTVEPGIYLPGLGGVRIEDDVLVTETGHRVLSNLPKDIASATV